jgi:tripartite-type tricarboxylate transporter receptor subunit TctC
MESGVPDFQMNSWIGIVAPIKTPRAVVEKLNAELNAVLNDPDTRTKLDTLGITATPGTPEKFGEEIKTDLRRFRDVVKAAAIKLE